MQSYDEKKAYNKARYAALKEKGEYHRWYTPKPRDQWKRCGPKPGRVRVDRFTKKLFKLPLWDIPNDAYQIVVTLEIQPALEIQPELLTLKVKLPEELVIPDKPTISRYSGPSWAYLRWCNPSGRLGRPLTQEEVADFVGISKQAVGKCERDTLIKFRKKLNKIGINLDNLSAIR